MLKIKYDKTNYLEMVVNDKNYLLGSNQEIKRAIYNSLKRVSLPKKVTNTNKYWYGDEEIKFFYQGKQIKSKHLSIFCLESFEDMRTACEWGKGSLFYDYTEGLEESFEIGQVMYHLNEVILDLEEKLRAIFEREKVMVYPNFSPLAFKEILKKHMSISLAHEEEIPLDVASEKELIDLYLCYIELQLLRQSKEIWLVLYQVETWLTSENLIMFMEKIDKISKETGLIKLFIIPYESLRLNYNTSDIEKVVIVHESIDQLPAYEDLVCSIQNNYPIDLYVEDTVFVNRLFRILPLIGSDENQIYLSGQDMVLFKVLSELMGKVDVHFSLMNESITELEKKFLIYK